MYDGLKSLALETGFENVGFCAMTQVVTHPELRKLCVDNTCGSYGSNWACPPASGTIAEFSNRMSTYTTMMVVQSVDAIEYTADPEQYIARMQELKTAHRQQFHSFAALVKKTHSDAYFMSVGPCMTCDNCTYPAAPCRFPDELYPSMEAAGLLIADVCNKAGIPSPFAFGPQTASFVSCVCLR